MLALPPLSLYIHLPWCVRKCPYCDFNSHNQPDVLPEALYIDQLLRDLACDAGDIQGRPLSSIFIGGGTPSLFSAAALQRLLKGLAEHWTLANTEITLEANPGTIERGQFQDYRAIGINRISLGVQSFHAECLHKLGRIHTTQEAELAIQEIQDAGFEHFNIDLMHGLPNQTSMMAGQDLKTALQFNPPHLSWYQLTVEPNTAFALQPPKLPDDDKLEVIESTGKQILEQAGLLGYEVSAYAKPGFECRHNLNYWQFGDYLAIGAGAHAKITRLADNQIVRYWKQRHPKRYLASKDDFVQGSRVLSTQELPLEFMMNALRLQQPISPTHFEQRTGVSRQVLDAPCSALVQKGFIAPYDDGSVSLTNLGRRYLDTVLQVFMT